MANSEKCFLEVQKKKLSEDHAYYFVVKIARNWRQVHVQKLPKIHDQLTVPEDGRWDGELSHRQLRS